MEYIQRKNPLFSACGLNCGLCPRYHTDGQSKCPSCSGKDFLTKHPTCGVLSCCQRHGHEYCIECDEYPCRKYDRADQTDSFITHRNQLSDFEKARTIGISAYETELARKVEILELLLAQFNDGRRKNFYCLAVNLLALEDLEDGIKLLAEMSDPADMKGRAKEAVQIFQEIADRRNVELKLRK